MLNQHIIDEVAKAFHNKETARTVRERLMLEGVAPEDVDEAVEYIIQHYTEFRFGPSKTERRLFRTLFIGGIIIVVVGLSLYTWRINRAGMRDAERIADIGKIQIALESYLTHSNGKYPRNLTDLLPRDIPILPQDPVSGEPYEYFVNMERTRYRLCMQYQSTVDRCVGAFPK